MNKILLEPTIISEKKDLELSSDLNKEVDNFKPYLIKDVLLLSPGTWNGKNFSSESIKNGFLRTDWSNKENYALIYSHEEKAQNWIGNAINRHVTEEGKLYGDLEIYDKELAIKLGNGKAKLGISAKISGDYNEENGNFDILSFNNFSVVYNPACKEAYINLSEQNVMTTNENKGNQVISNTNTEVVYDEKLEKITDFEKVRKQKGMSVSSFYAIPLSPPSRSKLPIFDKVHVRNALARISQVKDVSSSQIAEARRKIMSAAKKFGIMVNTKSKLNINTIEKGGYIEKNMEKKEVNGIELNQSEELNSKINSILNAVTKLSERLDSLESKKEVLEEEFSKEESEDESKEVSQEKESEESEEKSEEESKETENKDEDNSEESSEEKSEEDSDEKLSDLEKLSIKLENALGEIAKLKLEKATANPKSTVELSKESLGRGARNFSVIEMSLINALNKNIQ